MMIEVGDMHFERDPNKARKNEWSHEVSFEEAVSVFRDVNALICADPEHSEDEDRFLALGYSNKGRILTVVHCIRLKQVGDVIRIISARKATRDERRQYEGG